MEMEQVNALCEELVKAVTVMMDPSSTQRYRLEALKFCEEFKEKCPICVPCGLRLAEITQIAVVRHFGLQILEHVVKFRWNSMSRLEKVYLKNSVMELMANGTLSILEEENHIKDVLSRIVVEMIKREWPQHWPDMLMELDTLSRQGETQRELVMFILLRLAEDVVTFQTLPTQRRRDIQQTLTQNMERIFSFLLITLQENVNKYQQMKTDASREVEGKLDDRKPLMILFGDVAMHYILSAAQTADGGGLVEKHYLFLKRLCQVLCALGNLLCALLGLDANIQTPVNFGKYLESFLAFTTHPSQFLRSSTHMTWGALFRHEILSHDPSLLAIIPKYLRASMTNLVKMGFPSKTDSPSCEYSRFDFDSDEDFNAFFNSSRAQQGEVLRWVCRLDPKTSFQMAAEWLKYQLSAPIDTGPVNSGTGEGGYCSIFSSSYAQWEAMTFFLESVINQMFRTIDKEEVPVNDGIDLLQMVLNFEMKDPLILSCVLTNVSALFPFVTYKPEFLPHVFSKAPRTRAVRNVRRHACSSINKMCRDYPDLVLPNFDMLYSHVKQLLSSELLLTQMEKSALMEALVLISNQFKNYERQKLFLEELMAPMVNIWLSEEMCRYSEKVIKPLERHPNEKEAPGLPLVLKMAITFCVHSILGVLRRTSWPSDLEEARAGGFLVGYTPSGNPIFRNPCTEQILKLLDNLLALVRTHNTLYTPEVLAKMAEPFTKVLDILESEKTTILGLPQPLLEVNEHPVYKTTLERMQRFFGILYENCYHILGKAGPSMQQDFYTVEGLATQLLGSAFVNLNNIPDFRLKSMLHILEMALRNLEEAFPEVARHQPEERAVVRNNQPLLGGGEDEIAEDNPESQEMLEEQLVRMLTREVMDLINEEMMAAEVTPSSMAELTDLGKCLMKHELSSQVMSGTLLADAVTWLFTSVLKGLQMHGQHDGCMASLVHLAFQIYETLRPRYLEIRAVMEQIPEIHKESLDQFDCKLLNPSLQKAADKRRKDHFKRLIAGCIGKPLGEQFRKEVHIKNLPMLFKKPKPMLETEVLDSEGGGLATIFEP
ncbi:hypothetical protein A6R68_10442 [Neotoma lepida]|uniref:Importin N-terminal domain-containing protein n=1 Tax=Neotoma lepida TaxID=56216 RepID=A0A1A6FWU9_NEOLE|nr:hypothetical protein A6R68_10442 [Neotoma lepida]